MEKSMFNKDDKKYDSIIVLSHQLTPDWELSGESELRVKKGAELFKDGYSNFVIMNGGPGKFANNGTPYGKFVPRGFHPVQCEAMRDYALTLRVSKKNILMQNFSSDTIGEAFFVKKMLLAPNKWHKNIIVTSGYHRKRASLIYDVILGKEYESEIIVVQTNRDNDKKTIEKEEKAIERFKKDYGDIEPGDSHAFEVALYERHDIYSKIPKSLRPKFFGNFFISLSSA